MLMGMLSVQTICAQDKKPNWPGVTMKVLVDNDKVNVSEVTFAPGAVADWHSHPQYTAYARTDVTMKIEMKDKDTRTVNLKAGEAIYSDAVMHRTSNVGKKPFTMIVTEMKQCK
jgi:quercetin dioxygenase-like cupin family protein